MHIIDTHALSISHARGSQRARLHLLICCEDTQHAVLETSHHCPFTPIRSMGASFGSGMAYSIVSGAPNPVQSAVTTGAAFALFNGLFYQVSCIA